MQILKPIKAGLDAFLCFKVTNGHLGSEKIVILYKVRRSDEHVGACYQVVSADDATITSTSSHKESEMEAPTYSTMDSEVMNTSFEFWSISRSLKGRSKSKLTQAVEARSKILKTATILLSKINQEST